MRIVILAVCGVFFLAACSGERGDWRSAEAADTVEAYDHFIEQHPDSEHVTQARSRLGQLAEDREWQRASSADTAAAYRAFLAQHPNGKWAGEARIRVENFSLAESSSSEMPPAVAAAPAATGSGFGIQLGAFSTEAAAMAEWQKLQSRHRPQLGSLTPELQRAASGSGTVFRLQAPIGAEAEARGICAALAQASQPCVVVLPPR